MEPDDYLGLFANAYAKHGDSTDAILFSKRSQEARFRMLTEAVGFKSGVSVLDAPCGLAHLQDYLSGENFNVVYEGWDRLPAFLVEDVAKHPDCIFHEVDILRELPKGRSFDFVFCSGFNLVSWRVLTQLFDITRTCLVVNFLSSLSGADTKEMPSFNPTEWFLLARGMSSKVVLRHDYLPHDFTLYIYKGGFQ